MPSPEEHGRPEPAWARYLGRILLGISLGITGFFFVGYWGINITYLGRYHFGLALFLALSSVITFYVSLGAAAAALVMLGISLLLKHPIRVYLAMLGISVLPLGYLVLLDLLSSWRGQ